MKNRAHSNILCMDVWPRTTQSIAVGAIEANFRTGSCCEYERMSKCIFQCLFAKPQTVRGTLVCLKVFIHMTQIVESVVEDLVNFRKLYEIYYRLEKANSSLQILLDGL